MPAGSTRATRSQSREETLRDGLTVLTGYLTLLAQDSFGGLTDRQREIVDGLKRTVGVLTNLVGPVRSGR